MPELNQKRVVLIAGPTASGKSTLALELAREQNGVIINADSMQVYRELRILTARPTPADEARAPHRLYGYVSGAQAYSVAAWQAQAVTEIDAAMAAGRLAIVCGGTGLYFASLLKGLAQVPEVPVEVRRKWRDFTGNLHTELAARDPASAARLHPSDRQRLVRALEVVEGTGLPLTEWQMRAKAQAPLKGFEARKLFKAVPREELYSRADARFAAMIEQGALDEVRELPRLEPQQPLMKAIGVPELQAHLRGEISLEKAVTEAQTATRNYIKRQLTWWRGQMKGWEVFR